MSEETDPVPYYLMPVAAMLGTYAFCAFLNACYKVYKVCTFGDPKSTKNRLRTPPTPIKSKSFFFLILSIILCVLAYGYVCATINNAIEDLTYEQQQALYLFDPYEILGVTEDSTLTNIKSAYRELSRIHHPDKGGDEKAFHRISMAYRTLSDETANNNWKVHGHPDGPRASQPTLNFALPSWLLHPEGNVALALLVMYLGMFVAIIVYTIRYVTQSEQQQKKKAFDNSVAGSDASYLASHLSPDSTHFDVLFYVATTPENIEIAADALKKAEELRKKRLDYLNPKKVGGNSTHDDSSFDLNGDWGDEDDENETEEQKAAKILAKKSEEDKAFLRKQVMEATGNDQDGKNLRIEGIDDGVLGQKWVETILKKSGNWPPKQFLAGKENMTFSNMDNKGYALTAMDHPAVRRNLCMTTGRVNSVLLNTHPELIAAGPKGLIDASYFKSTVEFRQRCGLIIEAALQIASTAKSYRLTKTIIETAAMFKLGVPSVSDPKTIQWFEELMSKTYSPLVEDVKIPQEIRGLPRLLIISKNIHTPDENEIATGDACALAIEADRTHAECFTKYKLMIGQKQGIPPQIILSTYKEGWWVLVRCERLGDIEGATNTDATPATTEKKGNNALDAILDKGAQAKFEKESKENQLLVTWPFIISNVAQKNGKFNVRFSAPEVPGKYKFIIDIKSHEYVGCDQTFDIEADVLDKNDVTRIEDEVEEDNKKEIEPKKDK